VARLDQVDRKAESGFNWIALSTSSAALSLAGLCQLKRYSQLGMDRRDAVCRSSPVSSVIDGMRVRVGSSSCHCPILDVDILENSSFHIHISEPRISFSEVSNHDRFEADDVV